MAAELYYVPPELWHHCLFSIDSLLLAEFDTFEFEQEPLDNEDDDAIRCVVMLFDSPALIRDVWHDELPLHLAVTGQIQAHTSLLRCRHRFNLGPHVISTTAVFNIVPREDRIARVLWERTIESLRRVGELAGKDGHPADLSQLLVEIGETTVIRVHGIHLCQSGESVRSPVFFPCHILISSSGTTRISDVYRPGC